MSSYLFFFYVSLPLSFIYLYIIFIFFKSRVLKRAIKVIRRWRRPTPSNGRWLNNDAGIRGGRKCRPAVLGTLDACRFRESRPAVIISSDRSFNQGHVAQSHCIMDNGVDFWNETGRFLFWIWCCFFSVGFSFFASRGFNQMPFAVESAGFVSADDCFLSCPDRLVCCYLFIWLLFLLPSTLIRSPAGAHFGGRSLSQTVIIIAIAITCCSSGIIVVDDSISRQGKRERNSKWFWKKLSISVPLSPSRFRLICPVN